MNAETTALLRELAAKLGTTVEHLYAVILKQVPIWVAMNLVWASFWIGLSVFVFRAGLRFTRGGEDEEWNDPLIPKRVCGVLLIIVAAFMFGGGGGGGVSSALTGIFNPEFSALTYILGHVR